MWQKARDDNSVQHMFYVYIYDCVSVTVGYHILTAWVEKKYNNIQEWAKVGLQLFVWKKT